MSKKEIVAIIASIFFFVLLVVLFICEKKYPEGGAELLGSMLHVFTGR